MARGAAIRIAILAETAKAKAEIQSMTGSFNGLKSKLAGGVAVAAVAAGAALGAMTADAIAGAKESAQIHRVLASQISNMGGAAKSAFGDATGFAESFGASIAKDDDDVLSVINKLSTFPDAFKKGSLGAEAMHRATQAAFDLEATGIGAAESNIIGIGKALNDPIKGMNALAKSGVSFSAVQQDQIKNFMSQGRLADAQRVLLEGIESNAKGAAAAQVDGIDRAKTAFAGFTEGLASNVLPYLDRFGNWFTDTGLPAVQVFFDALTGKSEVGEFEGALRKINDAGAFLFDTFTAAKPVIGEAFTAAKTAASGLITALGNPAVQAFGAAVLTVVAGLKVYSAVMTGVRAVTMLWAGAQAALNVVLALNPIGLVVIGIAALAAAVVVAYKRSETFRAAVQVGWRAIQVAIGAVVNFVTVRVPAMWRTAQATFERVKAFAVTAWARVKSAAGEAVAGAVAFVAGLPGKVKGIFAGAGSWLADAGRRVIQGFIDGITGAFGRVRDTLGRLTSMLPDWKGPAARDARILARPGDLVIGGFITAMERRYGDAMSSLRGFTDRLGRVRGPVLDLGSSMVASIKDATPSAVAALDAVRSRVTVSPLVDPIASLPDAPVGRGTLSQPQSVQIEVAADRRRAGDVLVELLRDAIRVRGGDPAVVLRG